LKGPTFNTRKKSGRSKGRQEERKKRKEKRERERKEVKARKGEKNQSPSKIFFVYGLA